ncbi:MAG TPA: hypothetical protein VFP61_00150, partial [Acidimicrobiales bacterium]|nr:hypothetical protein [Acidimicrobiales bacterium]
MALACAALVLAGLTAGCGSAPTPAAVLRSFAGDLDAGRWSAAAALTTGTPATALAATYGAARSALAATAVTTTPGALRTAGATATGALTTRVTSAALGTVTLPGTATVRKAAGGWRVAWEPTALDTALGPGDRIERRTTWP